MHRDYVFFGTLESEVSTETSDLSYYKRPISPDRELLVWEKWIQIRKDETIKLGHRFKREPVDLAMNLLAKVREDREIKTALEHSKIDKKPTVRGFLVEPAPRLTQYCECTPVYQVQRTAAEMGIPKTIEYVGVPKHIQETELGMSGVPHRPQCPHLDADYLEYRQKRIKEQAKTLRKIDPFRPCHSKLLIQGYKPKTPPPKPPPLPEIVIEGPTDPPQETISGVYALRINKSFWYRETTGQEMGILSPYVKEDWQEDCTSWTYYFNVPMKRIGRGKIFMQNLGTVALRYNWHQIHRPINFIPTQHKEQIFFFNKNEDVLSPGQRKYLNITFVSEKPGIYSEYWELTFSNICFFDSITERIYLNLHGDSTENAEEIKCKVEILKTRIHRKSLSIYGLEILNEVIDRVFSLVPESYPYKHYFLEGELFVMKNPVYYYHQTEVAKMKDMYKLMNPRHEWDLWIRSWRQEMMAKEFDERMKYYDSLKKFHSELLKPWSEGDEFLVQKYSAIKNLWRRLANKLDKSYEHLIKDVLEEYALEVARDGPNAVLANPFIKQKIRNLFYLHAYEHVGITMELCAGVITSIESNRWLEFDFCRH